VSIRSPFSHYHFQAAALFAGLSKEIERKYRGSNEILEKTHVKHRSYVITTVLTSVAFLEAVINEVFSDTKDNASKFQGRIDRNTIKLMASIWELPEFHRHVKILSKYQTALKLADKELFSTGRVLYQNVCLLIELRNALVHYKPEWIILKRRPNDRDYEHKFERKLRGKFNLNPLISEGAAFYPNKCLSYGCAKWALKNSKELVLEFLTNMNIKSVYEYIVSKLETSKG
jgi:hypothetical protein